MHKDDFPFFKNNPKLIYLDNAATTQKPKSMVDSLTKFYETENSNISRGIYSLSETAQTKFNLSKKKIASLINASPDEIIFTQNTTHSINQLVYSIDSLFDWNEIKSLKEKGITPEILLSEMEHHSNLVPWQQFAKHVGWNINFIKVNPKTFELDLDDASKKFSVNTFIFSITQASNVLGVINPVKELIKLAKQKNSKCMCIVDGAQSLPHLFDEVNVVDLDCDFLAFSGHKLYGPFGIGILYGKKELLKKLRPFYFGGGMISNVSKESFNEADYPQKFEGGSQNVADVIALGDSIDYIDRIGYKKIKSYEKELEIYALKKLNEIKEIKTYHPINNSTSTIPVISFSLEDFHPHDIAHFLSERNICVRAGHHCCMPLMDALIIKEGLVRISLAFYNSNDEIDYLVSALKEFITLNSNSSQEKRQLIYDLYKHPENFGIITNPSHTSHAYNQICGDDITINISMNNKSNNIEDIKFSGKGCAISFASASLLTNLIKSKSMSKEEVMELKKENVLELLQIPISSVRLKCALLPLEAIHNAIK